MAEFEIQGLQYSETLEGDISQLRTFFPNYVGLLYTKAIITKEFKEAKDLTVVSQTFSECLLTAIQETV